MAGFDNTIVYSQGEKLEESTPIDVTRMQTNATDVSRVNFSGNPEGNIAANPSSLSHDPVSGNIYSKASGTGDTGWVLLSSTATMPWVDVTDGSSPTVLVPNTGYLSDDPAQNVPFSLPMTSPTGQIIRITNRQASFNFTINQGSGQSIEFGDKVTTTGVGGSITSTAKGDAIELICVVADTVWQVLSAQGNLNVI